jgi:peptide/nickel transport system permease protein
MKQGVYQRGSASSLRRAIARMRQKLRVRISAWIIMLFLLVALLADFLASPFAIVGSGPSGTQWFPNLTARAGATPDPTQRATIPALVPHSSEGTSSEILVAPTQAHPFGTDSEGRDVFAGVVHGSRRAVGFALLCALVVVAVGTLLGAAAGFFGGFLDTLVSRLTEVMSSIPAILLVLAIQGFLQTPSTTTLFFAIVLTRWAEVARVMRSEIISLLGADFVLAARALGASRIRILLRHLAPHLKVQLIVASAFAVSAVVLIEAACDFLSLGIRASITWGNIMAQSRHAPQAYWLLLFPASALLSLVLAQNILAEALREEVDPRAQ